jgi:hypothetical protein
VINLLLRHFLIDLRHPSSTQLLDGGDIHGAVVEVARQTRHALLKEPSVLATRKNYATVAALKVHKREKFFVSDFEFFTIL